MYDYIVFHRTGEKLSVRVRNFRHLRLSRETRVLASSCLSADFSACLSSCLTADPSASVSSCMEATPTGWIFTKVDVRGFYDNLSRDSIVHSNRTKISAIVREGLYAFHIVGSSIRSTTIHRTHGCTSMVRILIFITFLKRQQ